MIKEGELICEVCKKEPAVGVACVPGVPYSAAFGRECLEAGAIPYDIAVINTAMCGGTNATGEWWDEVVFATLKHLNKSYADFYLDVWAEVAAMEEAENNFRDEDPQPHT